MTDASCLRTWHLAPVPPGPWAIPGACRGRQPATQAGVQRPSPGVGCVRPGPRTLSMACALPDCGTRTLSIPILHTLKRDQRGQVTCPRPQGLFCAKTCTVNCHSLIVNSTEIKDRGGNLILPPCFLAAQFLSCWQSGPPFPISCLGRPLPAPSWPEQGLLGWPLGPSCPRMSQAQFQGTMGWPYVSRQRAPCPPEPHCTQPEGPPQTPSLLGHPGDQGASSAPGSHALTHGSVPTLAPKNCPAVFE